LEIKIVTITKKKYTKNWNWQSKHDTTGYIFLWK